jgi:hypothetical protein
VPFFEPLEPPRPLPAVGTAIERTVIDFKDYRAHRAWKTFEYAKDIAAFANLVGGTLIIGAHEDGNLRGYVGLTDDEAAVVRAAFSSAVADRCTPRPVFDFAARYPHPDDDTKQVVVINIPPSITPIGVRVNGDKTDGYGDPCWVYPVRSGTDARYLDPNQLAMLMSPAVRRHVVMLSKIPVGTRVHVRVVVAATGDYKNNHEWIFEGVDEQQNVAKFLADNRLPLDRILSVYQLGNGSWRILSDLLA